MQLPLEMAETSYRESIDSTAIKPGLDTIIWQNSQCQDAHLPQHADISPLASSTYIDNTRSSLLPSWHTYGSITVVLFIAMRSDPDYQRGTGIDR